MWKLSSDLTENQNHRTILLPKWCWLAVSEMPQVILAYLQFLPWNSIYFPSVPCNAQQPHAWLCCASTTQLYSYLKLHPRSKCSVLSKVLLKSNEAPSCQEVGIHLHAFPRIPRNNTEWRPAQFWPNYGKPDLGARKIFPGMWIFGNCEGSLRCFV